MSTPAMATRGGIVKVTVAVWVTVTLSVVSVAVKVGVPVVEDFTVKVTTPELLDAPEVAETVSVGPRLDASVTVLPATGLLLASFRVTAMVEVVEPSAGMEDGEGDTVDCASLTAPAVNVTVAVGVTVTLSVVSVAVNTSAPAVMDLTVKVATPELSVVPWVVLTVGIPGPEVWAKVTDLPGTPLLLASFRVTVTVEVVEPSATTDADEGVTMDCAAVTAPAVKVTVVGSATVTLSVVSVAVKASAPAAMDVTVKVATPELSVVP